MALAPCSPFSVTKSLMEKSAGLAERHARASTPISARRRTRTASAWSGSCRPVDYLEESAGSDPAPGLPRIHFTSRTNAGGSERTRSASATARPRTPCRFALRLLPDGRARSRRQPRRSRRRRLGLERLVQHDGGGGAPRADGQPPLTQLGLGRHRARRHPVGHGGFGGLPRTRRHRPHRRRDAGRPRAVHAGRAALFRRP